MSDTTLKNIRRPSLTQESREAILQSILKGEFADGRVPAEDELAKTLGVSRTTIRAAMQSLQRDGFVTRKRGSGTIVNDVVRPARLGLHRLAGFQTLLTELGHEPSVDVEGQIEVCTPSWSEKLGIEPGDPVYVIRKLFKADGHPAIHVTDVVPQTLIREIPSSTPADDLFTFFAEYLTTDVDYAVVSISSIAATPEIAKELALEVGEPCLSLAETNYSSENRPVCFSEIEANGHYVQFDVVRR